MNIEHTTSQWISIKCRKFETVGIKENVGFGIYNGMV